MTLTYSIRSMVDLCEMQFSGAWKEQDGTFSSVISAYSHQELWSGLPFHADPAPLRFSRRGKARNKGGADGYALRWRLRFNRMLRKGIFKGRTDTI